MVASDATRALGAGSRFGGRLGEVRRPLHRLIVLLVLWLGVGAPADAETVNRRSEEYDLKAAFLFNFTQYVEWPPKAFTDGGSPFTIAIVGDDPFGPKLDQLVASEKAQNRRIVVRRFRNIEDVEDCQLLFLGVSEPGRLDHALSAMAHRNVLTVGETPAFTTHSGMVTFETRQRRLRLRINLAATRAAGLTISSKLLRQCEIVGPESAE